MVDRIGKGGAPPRGPDPARPTETGKTFDVQKTDAKAPAAGVERAGLHGATPLDQLKAGKIDFNEYLDIKVHEATGHLEGLSKVQLDSIRSMLRDRMATDPDLVDLVKQATGHVPSDE
jgi:hypothetical protein